MKGIVYWGIAYAAAVLSGVFAGRYGFKAADTEFDGWLRALALFVIAIIASHGLSWAWQAWRNGNKASGVATFFGCLVCFLVTLAGGVGTIAGSSDKSVSERLTASDKRADDRAEKARLEAARATLPKHRPIAAVEADILAAKADRRFHASEGCAPDKITAAATRDHCKAFRALESELGVAKEATRIDGEHTQVMKRLSGAPTVTSPDPQAEFLSRIITWLTPEQAAAWYALLSSLALEIGAMLAMLNAEINSGHKPRAARLAKPVGHGIDQATRIEPPKQEVAGQIDDPTLATTPENVVDFNPPARRKPEGKIIDFLIEKLATEPGSSVEAADVYASYVAWCRRKRRDPKPIERFAEDLGTICREAGIKTEARNNGVHCVDVKLTA